MNKEKVMRVLVRNTEDRASFVSILAFNGYKVWIETKGGPGHIMGKEYWVVFEENEGERVL